MMNLAGGVEAGMKVGDVVKLRSGGPRMTIAGVGASEGPPMTQRDECVMCMWFDGQQHKWAVFPVRSLDLLAPADVAGERLCLPPSLEARFLREYGSWLLCNEDGRAYEVVRVDDASVYDHGVPIADVRAYVGPGREIRKPVYLNADGTIRDSAVWCKLAAVGR